MKVTKFIFLLIAVHLSTSPLYASNLKNKAQMKVLGIFDAGQPGVSIIKLYDSTDDVVCYVLSPDVPTRKQIGPEKYVYEANSIGSISCLKVKLPVIPVN